MAVVPTGRDVGCRSHSRSPTRADCASGGRLFIGVPCSMWKVCSRPTLAARDARREVPQNDVVHVVDDMLQRLGGINDVSVLHTGYKREVSPALSGGLFKKS